MAERDFADFYVARFDSVRRTAYALCGNWVEAEELTQHGFVRLYGKWARVADGNPEAYLRTTLTRLFLDTRRRGRGRERLVAELATTRPPASSTGLAEVVRRGKRRQRARHVGTALAVVALLGATAAVAAALSGGDLPRRNRRPRPPRNRPR